MNVTNSIVDFFQGNPFNNPVGSLIEKATDFKNESENWTLFMEVCDVVNSMEDGPKLAIRAIKRRIVSELTKDTTVILYSLTLLEACVKNCGYRFHLVVCSRDFLQELEKIILNNLNLQNRTDVPIVILNRILYLIQTWYDSFKGQPDFKEIEIIYMYLIECGVQFPMTDLNTLSPINTPKRTVPPQKQIPKRSNNGDSSTVVIPPEQPVNVSPQPVTVSSESVIDKLSKDLQKVQTNLDIMCELMKEYSPIDHIPDDAISLMKNLYEINSEMQNRLLQLINRWEETQLKDASILFDMLRVNDEMNSALAQYGRYERAIAGGISKSEDQEDTHTQVSKSNKSDIFAAQKESDNFYDNIPKTTQSNKTDQKNLVQFQEETQNLISDNNNTGSRPSISALSSQEFDQFLSEQAQCTFSINNDTSKANISRKDKQKSFDAKPKNENSQLFDL